MGKPRIPYYEGDSRVQRREIRRIQAQMLVDIRKALDSAGYSPGTPAFEER